MAFQLPVYKAPDFNQQQFIDAPNVNVATVVKDGVAPEGYHAMSMYPEYFKIEDKWVLPAQSRMDCVAVIRSSEEN